VLVHAQTPPNQSPVHAVHHSPATYGELVDATCQAVRAAILLPQERPLAVAPARAELFGYQRFLRTCGVHLRLLGRFQQNLTGNQRHIIGRLTSLPTPDSEPIRDSEPSAWLRAAQSLGAAHDLLATHLDPAQLPRTAEAADLLTPSVVLAPTRDVLALLLEAVNAGPDLVRSGTESQKSLLPRPIPYPLLRGLRDASTSLRPFVMTAHTDASRLVSEGGTSALAGMAPAPIANPGVRTSFASELDALRTLRQLTFDQAHGQVTASPRSLRDLALLGAAVTSRNLSWLPEPRTGLERLARAQAHDVLEGAHASWTSAAEDLNQTVLGTTRAPAVYGDAIDRVRVPETHSPNLRLALLSALPRLGRDAAGAVDRLQAQNALVAKTQQPGLLTTVWRPIPPADARDLANRFHTAATSSEVAAATLRRVLTPPTPGRAAALPTPPVPRREVALSRSAQR